jgi:hypothetical protein
MLGGIPLLVPDPPIKKPEKKEDDVLNNLESI